MTQHADIDTLKSDINNRITRLRKNRNSDKQKSALIAIYTGVASAITTICIGIVAHVPEDYAPIFGSISLLTSASLTVVLAWDNLFNHKKLWVAAAMTLNELYLLETDIRHAEKKSPMDQADVATYYERYKSIMSASNERWYKLRE